MLIFHSCNECNHDWEDNERGSDCPECKSDQVIHVEADPGEQDL